MELALIAPVMALIVFGVVDLGRAYRMEIRLENAAREGAVYAQIHPNRVACGAADSVEERVRGEDAEIATIPSFDIVVRARGPSGGMDDVLTGCSGTKATPGDRVLVEVSGEFEVLTPMVERLVGGSITMTGAAEVVVQG